MGDLCITSNQLREGMKTFFGYDEYKSDLQRQATEEVGRAVNDVFISMPTGAGKSLCYMLPGAVGKGLSIIISPLLALIQDQMQILNGANIPAISINSKLREEERTAIEKQLQLPEGPAYKFLFLTPEQCATLRTRQLLGTLSTRRVLRAVVIDEAHCISEWGKLPLQVSTNHRRELCLCQRLQMKKAIQFKKPVFRENLFYEVVVRDDDHHTITDHSYQDVQDYCEKIFRESGPGQKCGIIYCRTRLECEHLASRFAMHNSTIIANAYHAGLSDREDIQKKWMSGEIHVVCATISFGMGIDNRNVRFVVHWNISQALGSYYQEAGRAGRDGMPAYARLYYSFKDEKVVKFLVNNDLEKKENENKPCNREAAESRLHAMLDYCKSHRCRHAVIAEYFGDEPPQCNKHCDRCAQPKQHKINKVMGRSSAHRFPSSSMLQSYSGAGRRDTEGESDWRETGLSRDTNETWRGDEDDDPLARPSGTTNFILEELAKRRKASEDNHQSNAKKRIPRNTLLKFPQADRIKRLSIQVRQSCMDTLQQLIERSSNPADAQRRALDLEYEAYESAVTPQKYRLNIDGCKKNLSSLVPSATSMQTGFVNSNVMNSQSQSPSAEVPKSFKPPAKRVKKVAEMETKPAVTKTVVSPVSDFNWLMPKPSDLRQKKKKIAAAPAMEKHEKKDAGLTMMVPETMMPGPLPEGNTTRPQSLAKEEKPAQVQADPLATGQPQVESLPIIAATSPSALTPGSYVQLTKDGKFAGLAKVAENGDLVQLALQPVPVPIGSVQGLSKQGNTTEPITID